MGSPDGTKVKLKCTFSPEVGNHAEPAVRTSSTSRHPPGFPPPTCIPGTIVSPSFGVDAMDPAKFSLGPAPSGMFHGPAVAPENLNPMNGHGVTSKVDVVEPPIHGPAITRERSQGRYGTDLGLPGESVHSLSDIAKMLVRCWGSEAVSEHSKFTGNPLDYFKFIRQVEDRILSLYAESDSAHALHLLLEATSGRAYKLISSLGGFSSLENVQLHVFADASSVGIGAVCYLRVSKANNCFVSFMMGKSRVAPAKPLTIPRLELCAAGIAVRLAKFVTRELDVTPEKTVFWSDSTTVLSYMQSTSKRRPVFETNRIKHRKSGHNAAAYVTNELRRRFYIVGQERTVKHLLKTYCMGCRNRRAAPSSQIMSPLPRARVEGGQRLFTVVGTDFMGPILTKCQRNSLKRYCCIFTCLASRATHLEIAYDLTTGSFLMALRRFLAARGSSTKTIYCDNGTNFIGARSELKRGLERLRRREICNKLSPRGIAFRHSPPLASHQGGVWKAILRLVKKAMDALLTDKYYRKLSDEGLWTLLKEIEYMLNCRPLTRVSSDPEDFRALSPMTLLNGCIDPQLPSDVFVNSD